MSTTTTTETALTRIQRRRQHRLAQKLGDALNLIHKATGDCMTSDAKHLYSAAFLIRQVLKNELTAADFAISTQ